MNGLTAMTDARRVTGSIGWLPLLLLLGLALVLRIWNFPKPGETPTIEQELSPEKLKHARCYTKQNIPARFHYQHNSRIAPIVCTPDEGWRIFALQKYKEEQQTGMIPNHMIGAHGYDNAVPSMRATFIAHGPAFKSGLVVEPFNNLDVYDIMTTILGLKPAANDGNMDTARSILR